MAIQRYLIAAVIGALASAGASFAEDTSALKAARETIMSKDLSRHLHVLAGDALEGREAGSRGGRAAGVMIVRELDRYGMTGGAAGGGYFQPFDGRYRNILAYFEGSDPELKKEVIVVGAHYDHVGYGNAQNSYGPVGKIHNGADDNASGSSGLLEVVEAFSKLSTRPKRSILFAFWDAEEKGLLGSKHWVAHPTIPLSRVKLLINMDMIGRLRGEKLEVLGTRTAKGLRRMVARQNDGPVALDFSWKIESNSDHHPFFEKNISFLMLHTGLHGDYHRPSDDVEKVNVSGMENVARLLFNVAYAAADAPTEYKFRSASRRETQDTRAVAERALAPLRSRLGARWKTSGSAAVLTRVTPNSPADKGGLRKGDRILKINGRDVPNTAELRKMVLASTNPAIFTVLRKGKEDPQEIRVKLAGKSVRYGLAWRSDSAEPGVVAVARVVPGSAADVAGLKVNDRIDEIGGQAFANKQEFWRLMRSTPAPIKLSVERNGKMRTVDFVPFDLLPSPQEETITTAQQGN